jgi:hypothetical protein
MPLDTLETKEKDKVNRWRWTPIDEARKTKAKGFPTLQDESSDKAATRSALRGQQLLPNCGHH